MAEAKAQLKNLSIAPRKVRFLVNTLKNKSVPSALAEVRLSPLRAAKPLEKLIESAVANARVLKMDENKLFIKSIIVNGGAMLKRYLPRARGMATPIQKKLSHVNLVLAEKDMAITTKYIIPKAIKKIKKELPTKEKQKAKKPQEEKAKAAQKKPGFFQKMFRRKSI
ncbi:MAG: 50S ribosomal protein L22 [Candidatus Colwellbacteria bacterium]|nr:50S ribosomal protein L22 [Candidatus Colwellbacteria bacterium]